MNRPSVRYDDGPPDKRRRMDEKMKTSSSSKPESEWDYDEIDFTEDQLESIDLICSQAMVEPVSSAVAIEVKKPSLPSAAQTSKSKGPYPYPCSSTSSSAPVSQASASSFNKPLLQSSKSNVQSNVGFPLHSDSDGGRPVAKKFSRGLSFGALSQSQQSRSGKDFNHNKVASLKNGTQARVDSQSLRQTNAPGWKTSDKEDSIKSEASSERFVDALKQQVENLKEEKESMQKQMQEIKNEQYSKDGQIRMLRESVAQKESELFKQQQEKAKAIEEKLQVYVEKEKLHVQKETGLMQEIEKLKAALQFKEHEIAEANANCKKLEQKTSSPVVCVSPSQRSPRTAKRTVPVESTSPVSSKMAKGSFPTRKTFMASESSRGKSTPPPVMSLKKTIKAESSPATPGTSSPSKSCKRGEVSQQCYSSHLKQYLLKVSTHKGAISGSSLMSKLIDHPSYEPQSDLIGLLNSRCWTTACTSPPKKSTGSENTTQHQNRPRSNNHSALDDNKDMKEENQHDANCCKLARSGINKLLSHSHCVDSPEVLASYTPGVHELLPVIETSLRNFVDYRTLLELGENPPDSSCSNKSMSYEGSLDSVSNSMKSLDIAAPVPVPIVSETALNILYRLVCYSKDVRDFVLSEVDDVVNRENVGSCGDSVAKQFQGNFTRKTVEGGKGPAGDGQHLPESLSLLDVLFQLSSPLVLDEQPVHLEITEMVLQVLTVLANQGRQLSSSRFSPLLTKCVPSKCLALCSHPSLILHCMSLVKALSISPKLIVSFCRHPESCVFLEVYNVCLGSFSDWSQDDRTAFCGEVVNLLWTVVNHHKCGITLVLESNCHCSVLVVKAVVMMLNHEMEEYKSSQSRQCFRVVQQGIGLMHVFWLRDQQFSEHYTKCELQYTNLMSSMSLIVKQLGNPDDYISMALQDLWDFDECLQDEDDELNMETS